MNKIIINIFWTGGWDSTFRILDLLILKEKIVQPIYIIDSNRNSTKCEISAMTKIKQKLYEQHPKTKNLILPTIFREIHDIQMNNTITTSFQNILKSKFLGDQYEYLARFSAESKLAPIELCVHKDDVAHDILAPYILKIERDSDPYFKINDIFKKTWEYSIFKYFNFPIFNISKLEMDAIAKENNFGNLMEMTWFCHNPHSDGTPCGLCSPCGYAMMEGLGRRIPYLRRTKNYITYFKPKKYFIGFIQKDPTIFNSIKKLFHFTYR